MLDILSKSIQKIFGNKSDRDIKEIQPIVEKTNAAFAKIQNLSNDELRAKTVEFQSKIKSAIEAENKQIADIKQNIDDNPNMDFMKKDELYNEIDSIEEIITKNIFKILCSCVC